MTRHPESVYLPHNEPYLGRAPLLHLDQEIPRALQKNLAIAKYTFTINHSPLQAAAAELVPQGISVALSIRELLRQGYLFSAVILLRPLLERLALVVYLRDNPVGVASWNAGWARKAQPTFDVLMEHLTRSNDRIASEAERKAFFGMLHKVVHPDPAAAMWNMIQSQGRPAFASGKLIEVPEVCDFCAEFTLQCLQQLIRAALSIFPEAKK